MHQDHHGYVCLLIQGATKDDAGWYTVSAKNEAGIVSCTARLDVYSKCLPVLGARGLPVRTADSGLSHTALEPPTPRLHHALSLSVCSFPTVIVTLARRTVPKYRSETLRAAVPHVPLFLWRGLPSCAFSPHASRS